MKKLVNGNLVCTVSVEKDCRFYIKTDCEYDHDTIIYAVERFFQRHKALRCKCTSQSWQIRLSELPKQRFSYPAVLMELPGNWIRISGRIDASGVHIHHIDLKDLHPGFETRPKKRIGVYVA